MKRKISKIIDVVRMPRQEAERILETPIKNLTHGDDGYLVNNKAWFPKMVIDTQSKPYEERLEKRRYLIEEIAEYLTLTTKNPKRQDLDLIKEELKKLIKQIRYGKNKKRQDPWLNERSV